MTGPILPIKQYQPRTFSYLRIQWNLSITLAFNRENEVKLYAYRAIGANCLVEIEVEADNVEIEEFVYIRMSRQEAAVLIDAGVERCEITTCFPKSDDVEVEFICILIVNGKSFAILLDYQELSSYLYFRYSLGI